MAAVIVSKEQLEKWYVRDNLTQKEIGEKLGCGNAAISMQLKKYGLRRNTVYSYLGQTFGMLTPIKLIKRDKHGHMVFECQCQCGNLLSVTGYSLKTNNTQSCGCTSRKRGKNHNNWQGYEDIPSTTISSLKKGALNRDLAWGISAKDMWNQYIKQHKRCSLTNLPIYFAETRKKYTLQTASLDRIDSKQGYLVSNIQWVHKNINKMKQNLSQIDFIEFCRYVTEYNGDMNVT